MKTLEELYKEAVADETLKKAWSEALANGKAAEFLKANGCDATEEEAKAYLAKKNNGEISDEELDNVAGGGCGTDTKNCLYCRNPITGKEVSGMHEGCYKRYKEEQNAKKQQTLL